MHIAVHFTCSSSDYGFTRTSVTTCSAVEGISLADACPPGEETYQQSTSGYVCWPHLKHVFAPSPASCPLFCSFRQIPGDSCSPTDESRKLLSKETLYCSGHEKDSGYVVVSTVSDLPYYKLIFMCGFSLAFCRSDHLFCNSDSDCLYHSSIHYALPLAEVQGQKSSVSLGTFSME